MRMFVAVQPSLEALEDLAEFVEPRQERDSPLRWSSDEQWHLTLAFLPAVPDRNYDELVERLTETAGRRKPFELRLQGAGCFPNPAVAKVLWAGAAGDTEALERLAASSRSAAVRAGLEVDGSKFRPHLTLARAGRPLEMTRWLRVFDLYTGPSWQVSEIALIQSQLGSGRPRYQVRAEFQLGVLPAEVD
jgi:2'-5' RNA ligase